MIIKFFDPHRHPSIKFFTFLSILPLTFVHESHAPLDHLANYKKKSFSNDHSHLMYALIALNNKKIITNY